MSTLRAIRVELIGLVADCVVSRAIALYIRAGEFDRARHLLKVLRSVDEDASNRSGVRATRARRLRRGLV